MQIDPTILLVGSEKMEINTYKLEMDLNAFICCGWLESLIEINYNKKSLLIVYSLFFSR
jgi:hypothetical protein